MQPGESRKVNGGLGVAGTLQNATILGVERIDMTRTAERLRSGIRIRQGADGGRTVLDGHTGRATLQFVDRHGERSAEHRGVVIDLRSKVEFLATFHCDGGTQYTTGVLQHEIDIVGGNLFSGDNKVAFVLAILVVDYDYELAVAEVFESVFNLI